MGRNQKKKKQGRGVNTPQARRGGGAAARAGEEAAVAMAPVPLASAVDDLRCEVRKVESTECKHVQSGINLGKLRKQFARKVSPECHDCKNSTPVRAKGRARAVAAKKKILWICLACGQIGCGSEIVGSSAVAHATSHSKTWLHTVVMQLGESMDCWCLLCNAQLEYVAGDDEDKSAKLATQPLLLRGAATVLRDSLFPSAKADVEETVPDVVVDSEVKSEVVVPEVEPVPEIKAVKIGSRRVIKGLMNLGNTCFFNSVMQNLVGVSMLREHFIREESGQEGVLKVSLRRFFQEMDPNPAEKTEDGMKTTVKTRSFGYSMGNGAVSPRGLFSAICTKAPRFKGFQQQDSHELLRCLLDGLHMEEESIQKAQRAENEEEEGSGKLPDTLVERLFGGQFSSTISSRECGHSSVIYEPFLDLSLPIPSKQNSGKGDSFSLHLPKLIAPRSQSNGKAAGSLQLDSKPEAPKKLATMPLRGISLQNSIAGGRAATSETSIGSGSSVEEKDDKGTVAGSTVICLPCESLPSSSSTEKTDTWLDSVDEPKKGDLEGIAGRSAMADSDTVMATANGTLDGAAHSQGEASSKGVDDSSTSQEMFSSGSQMEDVPLENGHGMEEAPVYGPLPYGGFEENSNECRALVLVPNNSNVALVADESSSKPESSSNSKPEPAAAAPLLLTARGSEEDGEEDAGLGGLFDDDDSSFSTVAEYRFETSSHESSSFSLMDTLAAVPVLGPVLSGRSGSGRIAEAETYPTMSLEGCLQAFTKTEVLSGDNAWACEECTRMAHAKREAEEREAEEREAEEREAEEREQEETESSQETEGRSGDVGSTCADATVVTVSGGDGEAMQGDWEALDMDDYRMADSISSTNSMEMVAIPDGSRGKLENGNIPALNGYVNGVDRYGGNFTDLSIAGGDASNNGGDSSRSSDGLRPAESTAQVVREDTDGANAVVDCISKRTRSSDTSKKDRKVKVSAKTVGKAKGARKVEKDPPKMVTVKRDATKRFLISKAPLVLTVHLKRFAQDLHGRLSKLGGHITFKEQLDLGPFMDHRNGGEPCVYQLIGTVEHSGTMRGGHYVAYVKGCKMEGKETCEDASTWYYISDSHVRETCLESVLQSEAYLLFYERKTS